MCTAIGVGEVFFTRILPVIVNKADGFARRDGISSINSKARWLEKVDINVLLASPSPQSSNSLQEEEIGIYRMRYTIYDIVCIYRIVYDIEYDIVYDIVLPEASGVFYVLPLLTATEDIEVQARKD
jgi:hypothetical protein